MADPLNPDRGAQVPGGGGGGKKKTPPANPFGGAPPPVPQKPGSKNKIQAYLAWAKAHGVAQVTATDIWYWAHNTPNVDAYLWTSVLLAESGAKHLKDNGQLVSSGQAVGIGQIALSWIGQPIPWDKAHKFTGDNNPHTGIGNYGVNLRMSAYLWGDAVSNYGWKAAYTSGYNPNDPNKGKAWAAIQKTYGSRPAGNPPVGSPSQGPADTSPGSQTGTSTQTLPFTDLFVAGVGKNNKLVLTRDPNKALQYDGTPLTRSAFLSLRENFTSDFVSYTGQRPSNSQIETFLYGGKKGKPGVTPQNAVAWSQYQLDSKLADGKNFTKSPVWKQNAIPLQEAVKDYLPAGTKVSAKMMKAAILNRWDASTLVSRLQKTPQYLQSNNFKGQVSSMMNVYQSIMGNPAGHSAQAMTTVRDAVLAGWTADQYASYLRHQDEYKYSNEYQGKAMSFLSALGLITGSQTVARVGALPGPGGVGPDTTGNIPVDKRVKGDPNAPTPAPLSGLGLTLSG